MICANHELLENQLSLEFYISMQVLRSLLAPSEIAKVISNNYYIDNIVNYSLIKFGGSNDIYFIETNTKKYIGKLYSQRKCWPYISSHYLFEVNYHSFLEKKGILCPKPIRTSDNQLLLFINTPEYQKYFCLYAYLDGRTLSEDELTPEICFILGKHLANLHLAADQFKLTEPTHRYLNIKFLLEMPYQRLINFYNTTKFSEKIKQDTSDIYYLLKQEIELIDLQQLMTSWIHGDLHLQNYFFLNNGNYAFLDFELSGHGYYIYDIATFYWKLAYSLEQSSSLKLFEYFVAGYQHINPTIKKDLSYLKTFARLRHFFLLGSSAILYPDNPQQLIPENFQNYLNKFNFF